MRIPGPPRLFRLRTHFGTQVYLDTGARLRHGPVEGNADNTWAQVNGTQLILWHDGGQDGFCALGFPRAWNGTPICLVSEHGGSEVWLGEPQVFKVERTGQAIGLRYQHTYLCSEPDGRVVFNRESFDVWERFTLVEEPSPLADPIEEPRTEELTLEQLTPHTPEPPPEASCNEAIAEAEPYAPFMDRAEHVAAGVASIHALPRLPPRPGLWRRPTRLLFGV